MAKIIKITPDCLDELRREFEQALATSKLADGKINFTKSFNNIKRDATVFFKSEAWQKMQALIKGFDKEVAWHGIAYRGEDSNKDEYFITDILVYPQEVTGSTVTTDQEKYQSWLMSHEDEVFNNIRMQGHSHVNMSTSPSGVDTSLYERILEQLDDDMFYIFLIYNKRGEKTFKIYDLAKNVLFETGDVTVVVQADGDQSQEIRLDGCTDEENKALTDYLVELRTKKRMDAFTKSAKEMVKDKVTVVQTYGGYSGHGGYSGYSSCNYGSGYGNYGSSYNPVAPKTTPLISSASKKEEQKDSEPVKVENQGKKRKGKRKKEKAAAKSGSHQQTAIQNASGDQWEYPYSPFGGQFGNSDYSDYYD